MQKIDCSSGDLILDRRLDWAKELFQQGEYIAAASLMEETVALAPQWAAGWFVLGEFYEAAGEIEKACHAWTITKKIDPLDPYGAILKLSLFKEASLLEKPPIAFVETLFDQYADRFDESLEKKLEYRVPHLIERAMQHNTKASFDVVIDLGCGTGLMGEKLRKYTKKLYGYDISLAMLEKARKKNIYDHLIALDISNLLENVDPSLQQANLITAADVFTYLGCLKKILLGIHVCLQKDGYVIFSVESHPYEEDFILQKTRRYAHGEGTLRSLLQERGFIVQSIEKHILRMDGTQPVDGLIVVGQKA